ncbi:hypothetical protein H6P81_016845 [Aristolochia fimbriata]|uniref:Uncharacterized protein n=1 Tax=Aristolochia fimbriata TaxID=158543 RepID=A0AAV7DXS0_ARIFI|nr:hypothetical protein H6P81_016845 [Aristolochia fimbriata]
MVSKKWEKKKNKSTATGSSVAEEPPRQQSPPDPPPRLLHLLMAIRPRNRIWPLTPICLLLVPLVSKFLLLLLRLRLLMAAVPTGIKEDEIKEEEDKKAEKKKGKGYGCGSEGGSSSGDRVSGSGGRDLVIRFPRLTAAHAAGAFTLPGRLQPVPAERWSDLPVSSNFSISAASTANDAAFALSANKNKSTAAGSSRPSTPPVEAPAPTHGRSLEKSHMAFYRHLPAPRPSGVQVPAAPAAAAPACGRNPNRSPEKRHMTCYRHPSAPRPTAFQVPTAPSALAPTRVIKEDEMREEEDKKAEKKKGKGYGLWLRTRLQLWRRGLRFRGRGLRVIRFHGLTAAHEAGTFTLPGRLQPVLAKRRVGGAASPAVSRPSTPPIEALAPTQGRSPEKSHMASYRHLPAPRPADVQVPTAPAAPAPAHGRSPNRSPEKWHMTSKRHLRAPRPTVVQVPAAPGAPAPTRFAVIAEKRSRSLRSLRKKMSKRTEYQDENRMY